MLLVTHLAKVTTVLSKARHSAAVKAVAKLQWLAFNSGAIKSSECCLAYGGSFSGRFVSARSQ